MKDKKIVILLIVAIILIILMGIIILKLKEQLKTPEEIVISEEGLTLTKETTLYEVSNKALLFTMEDYLKETLNVDYNIYIWKLYMMEKITNETYFAQMVTNKKGVAYVVINLDYNNKAYSIEQITEKDFNNAVNGIIDEKYVADVMVQNNGKNNLKYKYLSDEKIGQYYFDMIKDLSINYPEIIYERLTEEYKKQKFNNSYEEFVNYCNSRKVFINDKEMDGCAVTTQDDNKIYECIDKSFNIYKIIEKNAAEFKIELDDYTVLSEEFLDSYNTANNNKKVSTNVEKFIKMVNNQDYTSAYEILNKAFKNNKFPTKDLYVKYLSENYYKSNIFTISKIEEQGEYYIVTFGIRRGDTMTTEDELVERQVAIKLTEGNNFEMSIISEE